MTEHTEYYLIPLKKISCSQPRSSYSEQIINDLATNILATGVLLEPLIVTRSGPQSYDLMEGELNYYAAVRAQEISPREAEMVSAFVVDPSQIEAARNQLSLVKVSSGSATPSSVVSTDSDLSIRLTNLESRLDQGLQSLKIEHHKEYEVQNQRIRDLEERLPDKVEPLAMFNYGSEAELLRAWSKVGFKGKTAEKALNSLIKARSEKTFTSLSEVVKLTQGISPSRMLAIVDMYSGLDY